MVCANGKRTFFVIEINGTVAWRLFLTVKRNEGNVIFQNALFGSCIRRMVFFRKKQDAVNALFQIDVQVIRIAAFRLFVGAAQHQVIAVGVEGLLNALQHLV